MGELNRFTISNRFKVSRVNRVLGCYSSSSGERKKKSAFHRIPAVINHQGEQILPRIPPASARRKDTSDVDRAPFGSCS